MNKVKIKVGIIGYLPFEFNRKKIKNWKSEIFEVLQISDSPIHTPIADSANWRYSDDILNKTLPLNDSNDIFVGITYIPIQDNYYVRRLDNNRIIISFFDIHEYITSNGIPIENLVLRMMYASSLLFCTLKKIPSTKSGRHELLHDDTRGCIFDMTAHKLDVIYSLNKPKLCDSCISMLKSKKTSINIIEKVNNELKKVKKDRYFQIVQLVKANPIISLLLTFLSGVIAGVISNFVYNALCNVINRGDRLLQ